MTDLEMTKLCAEAMGWHTGRPASKVVGYKVNDCAIIAGNDQGGESVYDPLHYDEQAMALVKKLRLSPCAPADEDDTWEVIASGIEGYPRAIDKDLNRAIVVCVANVQAAL